MTNKNKVTEISTIIKIQQENEKLSQIYLNNANLKVFILEPKLIIWLTFIH
jgi:hypothetical protein